MTNRRGLAASSARASRAFQFVPGHVGGRVDSAQPVRRRKTVGGYARPEGSPPTGAVLAHGERFEPIPAAPTGVTHAAILYSHTGYLTIADPPAGFTRVDSDTFGSTSGQGPMTWQVVTSGALVAGTVPTFTLGTVNPDEGQSRTWVVVYFTGGDGGGALTVERGPHYPATSYAEFNTAPPAGAEVWVYLGALKGVYAALDTNVAGLGVASGLIGSYNYPGTGTHAAPSTTLPADAYLDWSSLGAYGSPGSQALCVGWLP